jgi:hypothetical protein
MTNKKITFKIFNPIELFLKTAYMVLKLKIKHIRIITKFVNYLLLVWHVINLASTRIELRRMIQKKRNFPYEDYSAYM